MADTNYLHTSYAYSADGTNGFTTVYPNLNLLDGTRDFSGDWINGGNWKEDGTYKGLTVKSYQKPWDGMFKKYIIPEDGLYTWSSFVKSELDTSKIWRILFINNSQVPIVGLGSKFDWLRDSVTVSLKKGDEVIFNYGNSENNGGKLSVAGYKLEHGSVATPYMQSSSEATTADWPKYVGTYVDTNPVSSTDSSKYVWDEMKYRVYLDGIPVGGSKLLSFDLENLKADTTYNVQVSQINGNDESDKSESVAFKTLLTN